MLDIPRKLASLLTILCGQCGREILSVIDIQNTTIEGNFRINLIRDKLKTTSIKFHVREIKFPVYENTNVFSELVRGSITCLFIATSNPYSPASRNTLVRWIKSVLHDAGIDMTIHRTQQDWPEQAKQQQKYL